MLDAPGTGRRDRTRYAHGNRRRLAMDDLLRLLGDAGESQEINSGVENEIPPPAIRLRPGDTSSPPAFESQSFSRTNREAIAAAIAAADRYGVEIERGFDEQTLERFSRT